MLFFHFLVPLEESILYTNSANLPLQDSTELNFFNSISLIALLWQQNSSIFFAPLFHALLNIVEVSSLIREDFLFPFAFLADAMGVFPGLLTLETPPLFALP